MKLVDEQPKYLYHYTSLNNLGYILRDRKIKFNNLSKADDLLESYANEKEYGKYVFVSCWTGLHHESIPMWKMYSNDLCGVRIKVKTNPFKSYIAEANDNSSYTDKLPIPGKEVFESDFTLTTLNIDNILGEITYLKDDEYNEYRKQDLVSSNGNVVNVNWKNHGSTKSHYWSFQKEWRYKLIILPMRFSNLHDDSLRQIELDRFGRFESLEFDSYYLDLRDDAFDDIEVMLGPKASDMDQLFCDLLKEKYNPKLKIVRSKLTNAIR
jgi:hypothetical protein